MTTFEKAMARLNERETKQIAFNAARESKRISLKDAMGGNSSLEEAVNTYEKGIIFEALRLAGGVVVHAAAMLGVSRQYLEYALNTRHKELRHRPKATRARTIQ